MIRTIFKTEKIINIIERALDNVILIVLMNLLISLPLYFVIYVLDILKFPFELINNIRERKENYTYSEFLSVEQYWFVFNSLYYNEKIKNHAPPQIWSFESRISLLIAKFEHLAYIIVIVVILDQNILTLIMWLGYFA